MAPIPGETKVWQYVTLMKRIYLIDCPGVVPPNQNDTPQDILMRGVVRVEKVDNPEQYIPGILKKVKTHHMERTYELKGWTDHMHFLELLARKSGRLLKGGEPDLDGIAKLVLNDFMRGRIPWFTPAPVTEGEEGKVVEGREGRLGEMPRKRKRDDGESVADTSMAASEDVGSDAEENEDDEDDEDDGDDFEGFDNDSDSDSDDEAISKAKQEAVKKAAAKKKASKAEDMIPLDASSDDDDDASEDGD